MLPFDQQKKQKFRCFCCGREFSLFDSYSSHIKDNHEQGRDFVLCPVHHCQAPVRDLKTHMKTKHPEIKGLPPGVQFKAMIWRDQTPDGKLKARKPTFRSGTLLSRKNGKEVPYRSGMECKIYECLEEIDNVRAYDAEPFEIPYIFEGMPHHYKPDLSVQLTDGRVQIWEIKPSDQTSLPVNLAKWQYAKEYCLLRGWKFKIVTETGLELLRTAKQTTKHLPFD